ncbi:predicted protein [Uncinocarpus reesii 1704]|uniref:Uncharacterized protein n=1 Tax=Uncinocarpus reesii (strain UAMH 1704) TaxID=336963 RepID=C4JWZ8_UNCRE|nr:uncharacterized protein UREG_06171 [Uncinocarpus reesii 1704]EEP81306.1 predicted protein [Uncinocarpus reesii 1704]
MDSTAHELEPLTRPKSGRKNRNRKRNKQNKASQDIVAPDANDFKHDSVDNTHVPPPSTPSTAPPAYTSTPAPDPALVPSTTTFAPVPADRVPSPTARSSASFESADSTGHRRRRPRGGRKRRSKAMIMDDEEWLEEMDRKDRVSQQPVKGSNMRRRMQQQGDVEEVIQRDLSALEEQEQERDQVNGVMVSEPGMERAPEQEAEREHARQETGLPLRPKEQEEEAASPASSSTKPTLNRAFETGVKAFNIRRTSTSQNRKPITIKTVHGSPDEAAGSKKKEKKVKNKEKKKGKQQVAEAAEDEVSPRPHETGEAEDEAEEPTREEPSSSEREVRIKLDLNLEIEVLLKTKIKGEIMITFM